MFSQKIVGSDEFMDMPLSAQALYFHLNMRADDDGFINNPTRLVRYIKAKPKDLKLLIDKRFLISFDNGVIVIKHWRMHNTLRKDRYTPTYYQELLKALIIKENGAYTERKDPPDSGNHVATKWQPNGNQMSTATATEWQPDVNRDGNQMATQNSIEKGSIKEDGLEMRARAREASPSFVPFGAELTDDDIQSSMDLHRVIDDLAFKWGLPRDPGNLEQAVNIYRDYEGCPADWFAIAVERAGSKDNTKSWNYVRGVLRNAKERGDIHADGRSGKAGAESRAAKDDDRAELERLGILVPHV